VTSKTSSMLVPSVVEREVRLIAESDYYLREWQKAEARVQKLETALRTICEIGETRDVRIARAALTSNQEKAAE
jgi:hypothetical protein